MTIVRVSQVEHGQWTWDAHLPGRTRVMARSPSMFDTREGAEIEARLILNGELQFRYEPLVVDRPGGDSA